MFSRPRALTSLPLSLALAVAWAAASAGWGWTEPLERLSAQVRFVLRPIRPFQAPVVVVAIDEASLARYGQMPWDRGRFVTLLDHLHASGARVVGLDVAFNEPANPATDAALARAMARLPTVLPTFLAYAGSGSDALTVVDPARPFARAAAALGSVQPSRRQQAQVWELEPYQDLLDRRVPAFPIALAGAYLGHPWAAPDAHWFWRSQPAYINFRGPARSAPTRSAIEVLEATTPLAGFAGRIVLVGATATGLPDTNFAVPDMRAGPMAGVEMDAHALDNALSSGFFRRTSSLALLGLLFGLAFGLGGRLLAPTTAPRERLLWWLGSTVAVGLAANGLFGLGIWLDGVPLWGFLFSALLIGSARERVWLLRSRNGLLERYAADLASEAQRQRARLEGELHDGVQQLAIAIGRELKRAKKPGIAPEQLAARLARAEELADEALGELARLRQDLMPPALREGGLARALEVLASDVTNRGAFAVRLECGDWEPLDFEREVELFWLVREALNNAEKHAAAHHVAIRLGHSNGHARVTVEDDGCGFDAPDPALAPRGLAHSGLHRMWLRMQGRGGSLAIDSQPGRGARLHFSLPLVAERSRP